MTGTAAPAVPHRTVSVRTLGAFELSFDGQPVQRWRAGKARNLMQFLLLRPGHVVPRAALFEALWPDASWTRDSSSLKVAAHMLRNVLGEDTAPGDGAVLRLLTRDPGYLLEVSGVTVDFRVFEQLTDQAWALQRTDRDAAADRCRRAAALYDDDFLPDERYDWAVAQREWLRSRLLCACSFLVETAVLHGDHSGVLHWCRRLLDVEPFHEETFRALMLVHAHLGQLAQVERWYRLCVRRLWEHLQVAPDLATRNVHARAVRGEYTGRPIDAHRWHRDLQPMGNPSLLRSSA